jgi:disulfide oxidoreductase YuzD
MKIEELIELCRAAFYHKDTDSGLPYDYNDSSFSKWAENNLPPSEEKKCSFCKDEHWIITHEGRVSEPCPACGGGVRYKSEEKKEIKPPIDGEKNQCMSCVNANMKRDLTDINNLVKVFYCDKNHVTEKRITMIENFHCGDYKQHFNQRILSEYLMGWRSDKTLNLSK